MNDERKEELQKIVNKEPLLMPMVEEVITIEKQLSEVRKLPFYKVNPKNTQQQKVLPAFRVYKELLQQYTNCIKTLAKSIGMDDKDEESPLRKWASQRMNTDETMERIKRGEGVK